MIEYFLDAGNNGNSTTNNVTLEALLEVINDMFNFN